MAEGKTQPLALSPELELSEILQCSICSDICDKPTILSCGHIVCFNCIKKWIEIKEGELWCPECNQRRQLPSGGAESLPQSFRLNNLCDMLRDKIDIADQSSSKTCKVHPGKELDFVCLECCMAVCTTCKGETHATHFCSDPKMLLDHAVESKEKSLKSSLARFNELHEELHKNRENSMMVIRDFTHRFEMAKKMLLEQLEKTFEEKQKILQLQERELTSYLERVQETFQLQREQEYVDVHQASELLKQMPKEDSMRPRTTSNLGIKMAEGFLDVLYSDGETSCGQVVSCGVPIASKCELLVDAEDHFPMREVKLDVVLKDDNGNTVMGQKKDIISIKILTVSGEEVPLNVVKAHGGRFYGFFTPPSVGLYVATASVYHESIGHSPLSIIVKPHATEMTPLKGNPPFQHPHDVFKKGNNFLVVDTVVKLVNENGDLIHSFANSDWWYYPYSVSYYDQAFFITAMKGQRVIKYDLNGKEMQRFGESHLKRPTGIAIDDDGTIYVADAELSSVVVFASNGEWKKTIRHTSSSGDGKELSNPWFIKFNSQGQLVVCDYNNKRIKLFDPNTEEVELSIFVEHDGKPMQCRGVDLDKYDNIYVAARELGSGSQYECIKVYGPDGTFIGSIAESPRDKGLEWVRGIHVAEEGDQEVLFVVDGGYKFIRKFKL
ncbi:Tripartite motif-containing protein 3 [Holothuria leucospilota]|uniref:Tripartite motif-containing protein 3 n=1 Tax=Holothuria leucospilota TaxID=206669 RepID=A0A9Q0YN89_HOLLE|nr:Tripartite motif-containing protein 3 [Holothuria leucospilota]